VSYRLNDLEKELMLIMSKRIRARWTDIKNDVSPIFKKEYKGTGLDVIISRSLTRLVERRYLWKQRFGGSKRPIYLLSARGRVLARKIQYGLSVEDLFRDELIAFSLLLQRLRDDAITTISSESVVDYFNHFKERVNGIDVEDFIERLKINDMIIEREIDLLDIYN
jgi:hypothetical protein